jgi:hypothetical protein
MAPTATSTVVETQHPILKLRSPGPEEQQQQQQQQQPQAPVFPEGSALADLSRGPNPLTGAV